MVLSMVAFANASCGAWSEKIKVGSIVRFRKLRKNGNHLNGTFGTVVQLHVKNVADETDDKTYIEVKFDGNKLGCFERKNLVFQSVDPEAAAPLPPAGATATDDRPQKGQTRKGQLLERLESLMLDPLHDKENHPDVVFLT